MRECMRDGALGAINIKDKLLRDVTPCDNF